MSQHSIVAKPWDELSPADVYAMARLRTNVFFLEQKVDEEELDGRDLEPDALHLWIADAEGFAAYLRVLLDDEPEHLDARRVVGRVVVRADRRGEGLAQLLIAEVVSCFGREAMLLHAQSYIAPLYRKAGFVAFGDEFVEAGIPHQSMYRAGVCL